MPNGQGSALILLGACLRNPEGAGLQSRTLLPPLFPKYYPSPNMGSLEANTNLPYHHVRLFHVPLKPLAKMNPTDPNPPRTHGCGSSARTKLPGKDEEKLRSPSPSSQTNVSTHEYASQKEEMNHDCELGGDLTRAYTFPSVSPLSSH